MSATILISLLAGCALPLATAEQLSATVTAKVNQTVGGTARKKDFDVTNSNAQKKIKSYGSIWNIPNRDEVTKITHKPKKVSLRRSSKQESTKGRNQESNKMNKQESKKVDNQQSKQKSSRNDLDVTNSVEKQQQQQKILQKVDKVFAAQSSSKSDLQNRIEALKKSQELKKLELEKRQRNQEIFKEISESLAKKEQSSMWQVISGMFTAHVEKKSGGLALKKKVTNDSKKVEKKVDEKTNKIEKKVGRENQQNDKKVDEKLGKKTDNKVYKKKQKKENKVVKKIEKKVTNKETVNTSISKKTQDEIKKTTKKAEKKVAQKTTNSFDKKVEKIVAPVFSTSTQKKVEHHKPRKSRYDKVQNKLWFEQMRKQVLAQKKLSLKQTVTKLNSN